MNPLQPLKRNIKPSDHYLRSMGLHDEQFPLVRIIKEPIFGNFGGQAKWFKVGQKVRARRDSHHRSLYDIRKWSLGYTPLPLTHILCNVPGRRLRKADQ